MRTRWLIGVVLGCTACRALVGFEDLAVDLDASNFDAGVPASDLDAQANDAQANDARANDAQANDATNDAPNDAQSDGAPSTARFTNFSANVKVETGVGGPIAGFVIKGTGSKLVTLRVLGPSLMEAGVLADPQFVVISAATNTEVASSNDWSDGSTAAAVMDAGRAPSDDLEAAYSGTLEGGAYTLTASSYDPSKTGKALVQVFDEDPSSTPMSQLVNFSMRADVETNISVIVGGFEIAGTGTLRILVRGNTTGFADVDAAEVLANPALVIYGPDGGEIARNDDWGTGTDAQVAEIDATPFGAVSSKDPALIVTLPAGAYTAWLLASDKDGGLKGVALLEIYQLPAP